MGEEHSIYSNVNRELHPPAPFKGGINLEP